MYHGRWDPMVLWEVGKLASTLSCIARYNTDNTAHLNILQEYQQKEMSNKLVIVVFPDSIMTHLSWFILFCPTAPLFQSGVYMPLANLLKT